MRTCNDPGFIMYYVAWINLDNYIKYFWDFLSLYLPEREVEMMMTQIISLLDYCTYYDDAREIIVGKVLPLIWWILAIEKGFEDPNSYKPIGTLDKIARFLTKQKKDKRWDDLMGVIWKD